MDTLLVDAKGDELLYIPYQREYNLLNIRHTYWAGYRKLRTIGTSIAPV